MSMISLCVVFCQYGRFHLHWRQLDLSYANVFSCSYPVVACSFFSNRSMNIVLGIPHPIRSSLGFVLLTLFWIMNHVSRYDLSIYSVVFGECPLFLFLSEPSAILFRCSVFCPRYFHHTPPYLHFKWWWWWLRLIAAVECWCVRVCVCVNSQGADSERSARSSRTV